MAPVSEVKSLAQEYTTPSYQDEAPSAETATKDVATDPTIAHAAATELDSASLPIQTIAAPASNGIANANVADDAANAVGESHWDNTNSNDLSMSQEWVDVKAEAEHAPARATNSQSWADDHPEQTEVGTTTVYCTSDPRTNTTFAVHSCLR